MKGSSGSVDYYYRAARLKPGYNGLARVKNSSLGPEEGSAEKLNNDENLVASGLWVKRAKLPRSTKNQIAKVTLRNLVQFELGTEINLRQPKIGKSITLSIDKPEASSKSKMISLTTFATPS
ncbi:hypothetical protein PanWU01x14_306550 [Parasponia andersonii]|uniref:Uncharacterized protein n=1 Tax=Parasponia andersonii TaxID=3476 RepID=A0A2P5ARV5_PARAD|nr:hypothetical protein PanWU01x14_306550 [Parasponia andersonii]